MKTKLFRILSISLLVILFLVLVTLVAGAIAKSNLAKKYPAPGQLVDMGGYKMHINCVGQGSPTVILEAGWSDFSLLWIMIGLVMAGVNPAPIPALPIRWWKNCTHCWSMPRFKGLL
jgi:hypothetical protein